MEEKLVATIGIFLPTCQFIVDSQRHTFFESLASPSSKTNSITIALETERHVEILGYVGLGPEFLVSVLVLIGDLLNSRPAENGVVSDERGNITVGDSVSNGRIDEVGEESNTVLEVGVDNLHDTGGELHDADFR